MSTFGYIYVLTNGVNGRKYVGQTTRAVSNRWAVHCSEAKRRPAGYLHRAIAKHGREAFQVEVVAEASNRDALCELEKAWITSGGERNYERTVVPLRQIRGLQPKAKAARLAASLAQIGKRASDDTRRKMSALRKGRKQSPEHVAKRAAALRGKTPSPACRQAVAEANRRRAMVHVSV